MMPKQTKDFTTGEKSSKFSTDQVLRYTLAQLSMCFTPEEETKGRIPTNHPHPTPPKGGNKQANGVGAVQAWKGGVKEERSNLVLSLDCQLDGAIASKGCATKY